MDPDPFDSPGVADNTARTAVAAAAAAADILAAFGDPVAVPDPDSDVTFAMFASHRRSREDAGERPGTAPGVAGGTAAREEDDASPGAPPGAPPRPPPPPRKPRPRGL